MNSVIAVILILINAVLADNTFRNFTLKINNNCAKPVSFSGRTLFSIDQQCSGDLFQFNTNGLSYKGQKVYYGNIDPSLKETSKNNSVYNAMTLDIANANQFAIQDGVLYVIDPQSQKQLKICAMSTHEKITILSICTYLAQPVGYKIRYTPSSAQTNENLTMCSDMARSGDCKSTPGCHLDALGQCVP